MSLESATAKERRDAELLYAAVPTDDSSDTAVPSPWTVSLSAGLLLAALAASVLLISASFYAGFVVSTSLHGVRLKTFSSALLPSGVTGNSISAVQTKPTCIIAEESAVETNECPAGADKEEEEEDSCDDEEASSDDNYEDGEGIAVRPGSGFSLTLDFEGAVVDWPALHPCLSGGWDDVEQCNANVTLDMGERTMASLTKALSPPDGDCEVDGKDEDRKMIPEWRMLTQHCHSADRGSSAVHCAATLSDRSHLLLTVCPPSSAGITSNSKKNEDEGAIHLTLFASEVNSLVIMDVVPCLKRVFVPPTGDEKTDAAMDTQVRVSFLTRGQSKWDVGEVLERDVFLEDLGDFLLSWRNIHTKKIASKESIFQRIDVYDVLYPRHVEFDRHRRSLLPLPDSSDPPQSYESLHPEYYAPDRQVLLDGVIQSTRRGDGPYHEALVHPAMFLHPRPRRVAIIGGGEGATLREVLKHDTVEHVKMIDIDEVMVRLSDEFLPEWNDCSDIEGSHESCFKDPRADVLYEDAMVWFIDRFGPPGSKLHGTEGKFDVIIMDALDPQDTVEFANVLYKSDILVRSLRDGLTEDGVLVMQLGMALDFTDPPEGMQLHSNRAEVRKLIAEVGFESMHIFEESHCGFNEPWTFLIACKMWQCRARFYRNEAQVQQDIHRRIRRRQRLAEGRIGGVSGYGGRSLLRYFDGPTMKSYGTPLKGSELVYCRSEPQPEDCKLGTGYSPDRQHFDLGNLDIRTDENGTFIGVFARVDIPKMSYILKDSVDFSFPVNMVTKLPDNSSHLSPLVAFGKAFGMKTSIRGKAEWHVDPGVCSILQHGDNSTSNVGHLGLLVRQVSQSVHSTAVSASNRDDVADILIGSEEIMCFSAHSPVLDRHLSSFTTGFLMALRDIRRGEALLKIHE